jgi:hypothetical protein
MQKAFLIAASGVALALAACGQGNRPSDAGEQGAFRDGPTCQLVGADVFPQPVEHEEMRPVDDASGECRWVASNGAINAQLLVYDNAAPAKFDETLTAWAGQSDLQPIMLENIGDRAVLVPEMRGGQSQVLISKGGQLAMILVVSGDAAVETQALARAMAASVAEHFAAPAASTP